MTTLGLDIGGANVKAADTDSWGTSVPFALWKHPEQLATKLRELVCGREYERVGITMTGELADGYASKAEGVASILDAVVDVFGERAVVWQTAGEFVDLTTAREHWSLTAAANWHALATYVGRVTPSGPALLVDVGSTTTDVIPLQNGFPVSVGRTDTTRLAHGELVYLGVGRTPLCALAREIRWNDAPVATAAEWFATTRDVWLLLGEVDEDTSDEETADGRPRTVPHALQRVARTVCADVVELGEDAVISLAEQYAAVQVVEVRTAIERVITRSCDGRPQMIVLSGEGAFVAARALAGISLVEDVPRTVLTDALGPERSACACAVAVAELLSEWTWRFA